jgi:transcriptional regulator GlxA family with amidase domain
MINIYFLLYPGMLATSIALPREMLQAADDLYRARNRENKLHIQSVSSQTDPFVLRSGLVIPVDSPLPDPLKNTAVDEQTIIFLPGMWRHPARSLKQESQTINWIKNHINQGATVCAAATGAWFLAETGCLDGRPATTHWHYFDEFEQNYPQIRLKRQHLITQAGRLYCAGSINALADLTVHIIGQLFDRSISAHVERHFSHEARRPFENISFLDNQPGRHQDEDIIQVQLWLNQNFNKKIELVDLSNNFGMTIRTFNRRFKAATGKAPLRYLQELRIANGQDLLKNSNLSIAEVAEKVGYQDSNHFSRLFLKFSQMTPSAFRKSVRSKLFSL